MQRIARIGSGMVKALALGSRVWVTRFGFQGGLSHRVRGLGFLGSWFVKAPGVGGVCDGLIKLLLPDPLSEKVGGHLLIRDMLHIDLAGADPLLKDAVTAKEMHGSGRRTSAGGDSLVREVIGSD